MTNFAKVLELLADASVRFVVVGGYAAMLQGSAYVTQDLDICYERTPDNILRLTAALANLNPRLRGAPDGLPFVFDERTLNQGMNFTLATDLVDVDLLGELSGVGRYQELDRDAIDMELYGRKYRVASLDTLIRSKRAAGKAEGFEPAAGTRSIAGTKNASQTGREDLAPPPPARDKDCGIFLMRWLCPPSPVAESTACRG